MRSEHLVPLSPQTVKLLREIEDANPFRAAGNERLGKFLFPVASSKTCTISENRMLDIMYRIGLRGKATVHGFRGLASTVLNESGLFEPDWIEVQLAHVPRGGARRLQFSALPQSAQGHDALVVGLSGEGRASRTDCWRSRVSLSAFGSRSADPPIACGIGDPAIGWRIRASPRRGR